MSTKQSNQAVAERKKATGEAKGKKVYKRAAGGNSEVRASRVKSEGAQDKGVAKRRAAERIKEAETTEEKQPWFKRFMPSRDAREDAREDEHQRSKEREKPARVRIFPLWLRIIVVLILALFALVAGLMIGYGVIGDGTPTDALKVETWQHIIDIVVKE